jgi:hypothetical protein
VNLIIATDAQFETVIAKQGVESGTHWTTDGALSAGQYYWRADLGDGSTPSPKAVRSFRLTSSATEPFLTAGPRDELLAASLDGGLDARYGRLIRADQVSTAPDKKGQPGSACAFDGVTSELIYEFAYLPEDAYSAAAWFRAEESGRAGVEQILSCWCAGMDDPLRISLEGDAVSVRIEAGGFFATEAVPVTRGSWHHIAAVKDRDQLHLYLDGTLRATATVPARVNSRSTEIGIGCNPHFPGEWFGGSIDEPGFWGRALTAGEMKELAQSKNPR